MGLGVLMFGVQAGIDWYLRHRNTTPGMPVPGRAHPLDLVLSPG